MTHPVINQPAEDRPQETGERGERERERWSPVVKQSSNIGGRVGWPSNWKTEWNSNPARNVLVTSACGPLSDSALQAAGNSNCLGVGVDGRQMHFISHTLYRWRWGTCDRSGWGAREVSGDLTSHGHHMTMCKLTVHLGQVGIDTHPAWDIAPTGQRSNTELKIYICV